MTARIQTRRRGRLLRGALASLGILGVAGSGVAACGSIEHSGGTTGTTTGGGSGDGFLSDPPNDGVNEQDGNPTGGTGGVSDPGYGGDTPERPIVEAEVVQVAGEKLFALSEHGGLSVIDMSDPAHLSILGHHEIHGVPFGMHLQGDVVYAVFSAFGRWECDAGYESCEYVTSSHIEALDVSNPASIARLGAFDLPGEISDWRIAGDVLHAVSFEDGLCWSCQSQPETVVTSIDLADPENIAAVDRVGFTTSGPNADPWWRRGVIMTPERVYVAGIEWDGSGEGHSTVQIVDIADPAGLLHEGASVQAHGQIQYRWQMGESDGVLRVVSQPGTWAPEDAAEVQTFQVASSDSITPLAELPLALPTPGTLDQAWFDGGRLFVLPELAGPLYTVDLSDPAAPAQAGKIAIPGLVYHLEPRQDRLFALSYNYAVPEKPLIVSLYDVADMAHPSLIQHVSFEGDWWWAPWNLWDQQRIREAFKMDSDLGTLFVLSGVDRGGQSFHECTHIESGVQMVDFTHDSLTRRAAAPLRDFPRRAVVHDGDLFVVSDSEVAAFDIADRDAPARLDGVGLSVWVKQSARVGDHIVRISSGFRTNAARLEVVPANDPGRVEPLGELDLAEVVGQDDTGDCYGSRYFWRAQLLALDGDRAVLTWSTDPEASYAGYDGGERKTHVAVVNLANPAAPVVEGKLTMPSLPTEWDHASALDGGTAVVLVGDQLAFRRVERTFDPEDDKRLPVEHAWIESVDLSNPAEPVHTGSLKLPDGAGYALLQQHGAQILTSHFERVPGSGGKVRFYLDRASFAGNTLTASPSLNVPGALIAFDPGSGHALTVDFKEVSAVSKALEECFADDVLYVWYDWRRDWKCRSLALKLNLLSLANDQVDVLDSAPVDARYYSQMTRLTGSRVFSLDWSNHPDGFGAYTMFAIGDISGDTIHTATLELAEEDYVGHAAAAGDRLLLKSYNRPGVRVIDATDLNNPTVEPILTEPVYSVTLDGDRALCSMGAVGLEAISLQ